MTRTALNASHQGHARQSDYGPWADGDTRHATLNARNARPPHSLQPTAYSLSPRAGLSLIELLSSLTILVIMIGLLAIVLNNATDVWRSTRSRSRLIVQGRTALETIGQDLRQAIVNTNLPISVSSETQTNPYGMTNSWIQFCRLLTKPMTNQMAIEAVNYGVTTYNSRYVLGRWTQTLTFAPNTPSLSEPLRTSIIATIGPTNVLVDALATFLIATNGPCVDVYLALIDPDDARTATGIAGADDQQKFVERHAVRMSRRIYLPAQTPGGLP